MSEHVCTETDRLGRIESKLDKMYEKFFVSNGDRAVIEDIKENTQWREGMEKTLKKAIAGIVALIAGGHGLDKLLEFFVK